MLAWPGISRLPACDRNLKGARVVRQWTYHKVLGRQGDLVPDWIICIILPLLDLLKQHSIVLIIKGGVAGQKRITPMLHMSTAGEYACIVSNQESYTDAGEEEHKKDQVNKVQCS